jgi:flagellar biosynthesis/type III secretory pathway M-ring protein FliF/YscJ
MDDDFAPNTWKTRWLLLDGWLALLYLAVFTSIAFLWRPSANNRRLAMSDELATDDNDADDYEIDTLDRQGLGDDEDDGDEDKRRWTDRSTAASATGLDDDAVVFDIGAEGSEDDEEAALNPGAGGGGRREKAEGDLESGGRKSTYDPPPYKSRSD